MALVPHSLQSTVTSVSASASSVTLLASDSNRKGFYLYNDSAVACYVKFGATASSSSYSLKMAAGSFYEAGYPIFRGRVDGIWESATGAMRITEIK